MKLYKFFTAIGVLALAAGFTSCSDDDDVYADGFDGVDGQVVLAPTVNESYKFVKIPTQVIAPDLTWSVSPRARVRATEDLTMRFEIDNSLIESYNGVNSTNFVALPDGVVTMDVAEATITAGNTKAENSVTLKMTDDANLLSKLVVGTNYMVPVRMTAVTKGNARIAVSASNVSYITFSMAEEMLNPNGSPTGTIVPKAERMDWTGTPGDGAQEWMSDDAWLNPIRETGSYNYGQYDTGSSVTFDLGKVYSFDGIYSYPFYGMPSYAMFTTGTEIFLSTDGNNWTSLGVMSSYKETVTFYAAMQARYIKAVRGISGEVATTAFSIYEVK